MEELFDKLAKEAAGGTSRRQLFGRFGWGVAVAVFAALGLNRASADSCIPKCCETICIASNTPPGNKTLGECMRSCLAGEEIPGGICAAACSDSP